MTLATSPSIPPHKRPGGLQQVVTLAYPVMLTQLSETLMGVVDSAMVGRLGATELASVGFASIWLWTLFALFYGTGIGVQTFVAQADGAKNPGACGAWVWQGFYAVIPAATIAAALIGWFAVPALRALGPSPELQAVAADYVHTRVFGDLGYVAMMVFASFFHGVGNTRTPLFVTLFANAINIILDYALIFGKLGLPEMGVAGAGVATSIALWTSAIVLFILFQRRSIAERYETRRVKPDAAQIRRFLRTSAPIGGHWLFGLLSFAVFTTIVSHMGDQTMAASQAFLMLLSLSFMQAEGIATASATLVGRFVGGDAVENAVRAFHTALKLGLGTALIVAALFLLFPVPLLRIFTDDPDIVNLGRPLLVLGASFQMLHAAAIISAGSLRGAGDTRWAFVAETVLGWGVLIPGAYLLGVVFEGGLMGAWRGAWIHVSLLATVLLWRFHSRGWRHIDI
jgi:MATE family multidrug resistance protein